MDEAPREYYLENVATQTVLDALADVRLVLLVGQRTSDVAYRMEIVGLYVGFVHLFVDILQFGSVA